MSQSNVDGLQFNSEMAEDFPEFDAARILDALVLVEVNVCQVKWGRQGRGSR